MLARRLILGRAFARHVAKNQPSFLYSKTQVDLDKHVRDYRDTPERLHPASRARYNKLSQTPEELKYKLHPESEKMDMFKPLGLAQDIPWNITRTKSYNLPVYRRYTYGRSQNYTEIRLIDGDIEDFCRELKKVVSNSEVEPKIGKVRVKGLHKESVQKWLYLLGF